MITLERGKYLGTNKRSFSLKHVRITETEYLSPVAEDWHSHVNHHLTLFLQGGNREERKNSSVQIRPGLVMSYPSELLHQNRNTVYPSRNINIEIEDSFFTEFNLRFDQYNIPDGAFYVLQILKECFTNDNYSAASVYALLAKIFENPQTPHGHTPSWIPVIRELLNDRWNENISLDELSGELRIHPVTLSKQFPKHFGCTLSEHIRKQRVQKAIELIKRSNKSLTEISASCGFFDQSHFIRTFTNFTGFSPGSFKKL